MKIESILKPIKLVDEQILRQCTKLTKNWEDKGRNKYSLAMAFSISSFVTSSFLRPYSLFMLIKDMTNGFDIGQNLLGLSGENYDGVKNNNGKLIIHDSFRYFVNEYLNLIRTPAFGIGAGFLIKGGINLYDYLANNNQISAMKSMDDFGKGISFLWLSSSIYIRNSDPKILDNESPLQGGSKWLKERVNYLFPQPEPIGNFSKLEEII